MPHEHREPGLPVHKGQGIIPKEPEHHRKVLPQPLPHILSSSSISPGKHASRWGGAVSCVLQVKIQIQLPLTTLALQRSCNTDEIMALEKLRIKLKQISTGKWFSLVPLWLSKKLGSSGYTIQWCTLKSGMHLQKPRQFQYLINWKKIHTWHLTLCAFSWAKDITITSGNIILDLPTRLLPVNKLCLNR